MLSSPSFIYLCILTIFYCIVSSRINKASSVAAFSFSTLAPGILQNEIRMRSALHYANSDEMEHEHHLHRISRKKRTELKEARKLADEQYFNFQFMPISRSYPASYPDANALVTRANSIKQHFYSNFPNKFVTPGLLAQF
jgi:predicted N-acyltransferase